MTRIHAASCVSARAPRRPRRRRRTRTRRTRTRRTRAGQLTLEAKVGKEGNVLGALFALGQLGKDQEAPPALGLSRPDRLPARGQAVHVALGHVSAAHDAHGADALVCEVDKRGNDADGKDPFGHVEGDGGLNLGRPRVEGEEVDGGEAVDGVDGNGQEEREPEVAVNEARPAALGLEVGEVDVVPLVVGELPVQLPPLAEAAHGVGCSLPRRGPTDCPRWRGRETGASTDCPRRRGKRDGSVHVSEAKRDGSEQVGMPTSLRPSGRGRRGPAVSHKP